MYQIYNLTHNPNVEITAEGGPFTVITHLNDLGASLQNAQDAYYAGLLKFRRRQLICSLSKSDVMIEQGKMQWVVGDCRMTSGVKGVGDYLAKAIKGKMMKQKEIRPVYTGTGTLVLEPAYKDILLVRLEDWNGSIVLGAGMFLAAESSVEAKMVMRNNVSSAAFGNEGMFNLCLEGDGYAAIQVPMPKAELVEVVLENDILRLDGHFAVAWSRSLDFTVEKSGSTIAASILSDEGLVNTYTGTGKILLAPFMDYTMPHTPEQNEKS